jgi:hypothetical protein
MDKKECQQEAIYIQLTIKYAPNSGTVTENVLIPYSLANL